MLNKLLFKNQDKKQLVIAVIGAFLGITFLITSIHYLIKLNEFGEGADILGPNTIIVQKRVSNTSTLGLTKTDFSLKELEKMKAEKFIKDVKPVVANNFDVFFKTADPLVPPFSSVVFIQTIDSDFLEIEPENWNWKQGDEFVPMIMPREFLIMLNTFMSASGIPPVSDDLAKDINFEFRISNNSNTKKETVKVRIAGFSNEVSSLLVPESFMNYGNETFSDGSIQKITQVMISGEEGKFGLVEKLLENKGLESKKSQMVVGKLKSIIGTLFGVVLGISIITVFMSGLVLIQYLQLLITRNAYEARTLMRMGYHPQKIIKTFFVYFIKIFGVVSILGLGLFILLKFILDSAITTGGLGIGTSITYQSIGALILAYLLFAFTTYRSAKKGIFNEY
tara:strand:+ start:3951 stop:5132 length:1182 start_codon:yes stop_codon:yes gene_type:complete